jgi:hypothetical protein
MREGVACRRAGSAKHESCSLVQKDGGPTRVERWPQQPDRRDLRGAAHRTHNELRYANAIGDDSVFLLQLSWMQVRSSRKEKVGESNVYKTKIPRCCSGNRARRPNLQASVGN